MGVPIPEPEHVAQLGGAQPVPGFKELFEVVHFLRFWQNPENPAPAIVNDHDSEILPNILVPQRIAVVKETQVARKEHRLPIGRISRTNGGTAAAINPARAAVAENLPGRMHCEQLRIPDGGAVGQLQLDIRG